MARVRCAFDVVARQVATTGSLICHNTYDTTSCIVAGRVRDAHSPASSTPVAHERLGSLACGNRSRATWRHRTVCTIPLLSSSTCAMHCVTCRRNSHSP